MVLAGFWIYKDAIFSKQVLRLEILGPDKVKAGQEVSYTVRYKNNGDFVLQSPKLIFELPENSLTEDSKIRFAQDLPDIYPGNENIISFSGVIFGQENDLKIAKASLSYIPKNLSARYESDTTFTTRIETVPITFTFDLPTKTEKSKELKYSVNYFSNIDYPLENLSIKIDAIEGYTVLHADPKSLDNIEFKLDTLQKSDGGRINIAGFVDGNERNKLEFKARLGMWQDGIFVVLKEVAQDVDVIQPRLYIFQQINGVSEYVASPSETLHYEIFLRNLGSTPLENVFVIYRVDANAFDLTTLTSPNGQVKFEDNLIIFDYKQISSLRVLGANQEVKLDFTGKLKDNWFIPDGDKNSAQIKNKIDVLDFSQEFLTKVNSKILLIQKAYHSSQNGLDATGPVPPEVGQATTYVITWQARNYFNNVKNLKIKATLPQGVFLADAIYPESQAANFAFDSASRQIVWSAGSLDSDQTTSITFQVAFIPTESQRGAVAKLISQATLSAEDEFTGVSTQTFAPLVDTSLPDDAQNSGGGAVQ